MKYIRTKDGHIIDTSDKNFVVRNNHMIDLDCNEDCGEIVKEANTIEELCDEVVVDATAQNYGGMDSPVPSKVGRLLKIELLMLVKSNIKVYGAIWTDKGLIYVAKLNKDGELELL